MLDAHFVFKAVDGQQEMNPVLRSIYSLRYQVYINEWGFEKPEDHHPGDPPALHPSGRRLAHFTQPEHSRRAAGTRRHEEHPPGDG